MATIYTPEKVQQYYSGSQVIVIINDRILLDDTASFQIAVSESKQPIYGYGSQHYDFVAKGLVSVNGILTINYRHPNYLFTILAENSKFTTSNKKGEDQLETLSAKSAKYKKLETEIEQVPASTLISYTNDPIIISLLKDKFWKGQRKTVSRVNNTLDHIPFKMGFKYSHDNTIVEETVEGVELIGRGKIVESNGQPVQEQYNFIARKYY